MRQAATLIGSELLGEDWSDKLLDSESQLLSDIRRDLYTAMSSGEVTVQIHQGDEPHVLHPGEVNRLGFQIDIRNDRIQLRDPGDRWYCLMNTHQLEVFLGKYRHTRSAGTPKIEGERDCADWLKQLMRKYPDKPKSKREYHQEAVRRFAISVRAFDRIWAQAVKETHSNWSDSGRLKSRQ